MSRNGEKWRGARCVRRVIFLRDGEDGKGENPQMKTVRTGRPPRGDHAHRGMKKAPRATPENRRARFDMEDEKMRR